VPSLVLLLVMTSFSLGYLFSLPGRPRRQ
jgi:hypothetical protein